MPRTKTFDETDVLKKAMELFWTKGYHATSMQDLVDYLGINRASLYSTFGGKRALFDRAFQLYQQTNRQRMEQVMDGYDTIKGRIRALFEAAVDDMVQDPANKGCFVVNTTAALTPEDIDLQEVIRHNQVFFVSFFEQLLKQAEAGGELPPNRDLRGLAMLLFTLYNGLKVVGKVGPSEADLRGSVDAAMLLLD